MCVCVCWLVVQVVGIVVDADDQIVHLSASDAATACITRRQRIFVCTHFTVKSIRWAAAA